jgi:hypothetical protein
VSGANVAMLILWTIAVTGWTGFQVCGVCAFVWWVGAREAGQGIWVAGARKLVGGSNGGGVCVAGELWGVLSMGFLDGGGCSTRFCAAATCSSVWGYHSMLQGPPWFASRQVHVHAHECH